MKIWGVNRTWCRKFMVVVVILIAVLLVFTLFRRSFSVFTSDIYVSYLKMPRPSGIIKLKFPDDTRNGVQHIQDIKARYEKVKDHLPTSAYNNISCDNLKDDAQTPCVDKTCNTLFSTPEENWQKMTTFPTVNYEKYMKKMNDFISKSASVTQSDIVIVTGATSEFFFSSQGLLHELHEKVLRYYNNVLLVYYDLGLHPCERILVQKYCRCEVKDFPFKIFPLHIKDVKNYAWKPLVIQLELLQHKVVAWFDTSIRFKAQIVADVFREVVNVGIMPSYGEFATAQQSDLNMFKWFGEEPCSFSSFYEIQPGYIFLYRNSFVENIVKYWVACALNKDCISPQGYIYECDTHTRQYGKCHRFDQSALSIILTRLFQQSRAVLHLTKFILKKRQSVHYFPEEPSIFCSLW